MDSGVILEMLKVDLGMVTTAYDERLSAIINAAMGAIATEGITLDAARVDDMQLVTMYSAWLWRRRDSMDAMPRMLRWSLNNRLFSQKAKAGETDG